MTAPSTQIHIPHPERFTWDFWYQYAAGNNLVYLLFLDTDRAIAPQNLHHVSSRVG